MSPPSRRRGSKPSFDMDDLGVNLSPPSRRRGSKQPSTMSIILLCPVASLAEAWVETCHRPIAAAPEGVASLAEAWVETDPSPFPWSSDHSRLPRGGVGRNICDSPGGEVSGCRLPRGGVGRNSSIALRIHLFKESPPSRRRGSKLDVGHAEPSCRDVASLAEAWVETDTRSAGWCCGGRRLPRGGVGRNVRWLSLSHRMKLSPPSRRRGSKHHSPPLSRCWVGSPPSRRRGSKLRQCDPERCNICVASLAEAWVETSAFPSLPEMACVASLAEAWVETVVSAVRPLALATSPPSRRRGSKLPPSGGDALCLGRLPRGGVGRNVALVVRRRRRRQSPPSRRRGSKHAGRKSLRRTRRRLPRGGVGRNMEHLAQRRRPQRRLPRGGVGRNVQQNYRLQGRTCRLPRGGVGRNSAIALTVARNPVASLAEAWVETAQTSCHHVRSGGRLPRGGVGRNSSKLVITKRPDGSPPSRRRGSKHAATCCTARWLQVASLAEAWVETLMGSPPITHASGRLPRGGVGRNRT